jgi:hypothetical protein
VYGIDLNVHASMGEQHHASPRCIIAVLNCQHEHEQEECLHFDGPDECHPNFQASVQQQEMQQFISKLLISTNFKIQSYAIKISKHNSCQKKLIG